MHSLFSEAVSSSVMAWVFCAFSTLVLLFIPSLDAFSQRFEKSSYTFKLCINIFLSCVVVYHILQEAYISSGVNVLLYTVSGVMVAYAVGRTSQSLQVKPWPILPWSIAVGIALHGLFDGFAFRMIQQSTLTMADVSATIESFSLPSTSSPSDSSSFSVSHSFFLSLAVLFHRIPEGVLIWRLMTKLISTHAATITLTVLAITTFLGLVVTDEILSYARPVYVNFSYFQVFIAGVILYSSMITLIFRRNACSL